MNQLEHLREATDKALYGLVADRELKNRIEKEMLQRSSADRVPFFRRKLFPSLIAVSAALVLCLALLDSFRTEISLTQPQLTSISAGARKSDPAGPAGLSDRSAAIQIGEEIYQVMPEAPAAIEIRSSLGKIGDERILSSDYAPGTEVFLTSQDHIIAVRTEDGMVFLLHK